MKRTYYLILAVLLAIPAYLASQDPQDLPMDPPSGYFNEQGNPAGNVDYITYGSDYPARVYTPPDYDESQTYASMYLLHGGGGSEASWHDNDLYAHIQLDNLIAEGRVDGFVIVFTKNQLPDVGWNFTDVLIDQLIPYINEHYSVSEEGKHRALGGLSMGCGQTQTIANSHVDMFHYLMPASCGGSFRFSDGGASAQENLKLALITCGEREGDLISSMENSLISAGVSEDIIFSYTAPNAGHDRNTWRPSFWNFAQMAHDRGFTIGGTEIAPVSSKPNPLKCSIHQNPYSNTITIRFTLPQTTMITVTLFTIDGTRVRTLASGEKIGGQHILEWDGKDNYGKHLSTGVYMLRLTTGGDVVQRKIMLIR